MKKPTCLHHVGWSDVEYRQNRLNELNGFLKLPCCIHQQIVIGCVEWVNPNTHPTGFAQFDGRSVGRFSRYPFNQRKALIQNVST